MTSPPTPAGPDREFPWSGSDREQARYPRARFWLHLRPARLPTATLRWSHTMGLGGSSLVFMLLLLATGILQLLVYQPSADGAWNSVRALEAEVAFGSLVRGVHYWSANLLLAVSGLHLARVVLTGAFRAERRVTWWIGLALLAAVLASSFTGYLLPFDQRAWWAVTVTTRMFELIPGIGSWLGRVVRGGAELDGGTLVRFLTFHTTLIPLFLTGFVAWHFWRVRRAGGVILPPHADAQDRLTFFPHLFVRELAQASMLVAGVVVLAALFGTPLGDAANPGLSPNPVKAPWYFVGLQELLIHVHPLVALGLVPLASLVVAALLPRLTDGSTAAGAWFLDRPRPILATGIVALLLTALLIPLSDSLGGARSGLVDGILVPVGLLGLFCTGGAWALRRWAKSPRDLLILCGFAAWVGAFLALTLAGQFFRGPNMALCWPM